MFSFQLLSHTDLKKKKTAQLKEAHGTYGQTIHCTHTSLTVPVVLGEYPSWQS